MFEALAGMRSKHTDQTKFTKPKKTREQVQADLFKSVCEQANAALTTASIVHLAPSIPLLILRSPLNWITLLPPRISNVYSLNVPTKNFKMLTGILTIPRILPLWIALAIPLLFLLVKHFASFEKTTPISPRPLGILWRMMSSSEYPAISVTVN